MGPATDKLPKGILPKGIRYTDLRPIADERAMAIKANRPDEAGP